MNKDSVRRFHQKAARVQADVWGEEDVIIAGVTLLAAVASPEQRMVLVSGGAVMEGDQVITVRKEILPERPADGATIVIGGENYILRSNQNPDVAATWRLVCEPENGK